MLEPHPTRDTGRVFVGRQGEMAELTAALDDALSGQGRLVMLAGEPGIGKTRTAQALAALAEQRRDPHLISPQSCPTDGVHLT